MTIVIMDWDSVLERKKARDSDNLIRLLRLSGEGTAADLRRHIQKCGYDKEFLNIRQWAIASFTRSDEGFCVELPLFYACDNENLDTTKLLVELGADPDANGIAPNTIDPFVGSHAIYHIPIYYIPRIRAIGSPFVMMLLGNKQVWWRKKELSMLTGDNRHFLFDYKDDGFHHTISDYSAQDLIYDVMQGRTFKQPDFISSDCFMTWLPHILQLFVCQFAIPDGESNAFHAWLRKHGVCQEVLDLFKPVVLDDKKDVGVILDRLICSLPIFGKDAFFKLVKSLLSDGEIIFLIRHLREIYGKSKDKPRIETAMEILVGSMLYGLPVSTLKKLPV